MGSTATAVRHKADQPKGIQAIEDLDQAIKVIGLCDVRIQQVNDKLHVEVEKLKAAAIVQVGEMENQRNLLLALAQHYVETNREALLMGKKSKALNFGKVGFRKGKDKLDLPKKGTPEMEELVKAVEKLSEIVGDPFSRIPVQTDHYVLINGLSALTDKQLADLELERKEGKDTFFCEPDREKVKVEESGNPLCKEGSPSPSQKLSTHA